MHPIMPFLPWGRVTVFGGFMATHSHRAGNGTGRHDLAMMRAIAELTEKGQSFTEVPVEQLARQAGISRATFYLHYRDKAALVERLALRLSGEILTITDHWIRYADRANWADVHNAMRLVVETWEDNATIFGLLIETSVYDAKVRDFYNELKTQIAQNTHAVIDKARASNMLNPHCPDDIAHLIVEAVERCCYRFSALPGRPRAPWLIDSLTHLCWSTIYHPDIVPDKTAPLSRG